MWRTADDNPSRERDDCFVATTTAAIIAALGAAGGMTAGAAISARGNNKAAKIQTDSANHAADIGKETNDATLAFQRQQAEADWRNHETAQKANYAQYMARYNAAKGLGGQMGFNLPDATPYAGSEDPRYDSGGPLPSSQTVAGAAGLPSGGKGSAADLQVLLSKGIDPQAATAQFNQQFGRTTGNEAVYYDPSQHGGKAAIGLPEAYLSQEPNGWQITPRSGGGAPTGGGGTGGGATLPSSIASFMGGAAPSPVAAATPLQRPADFRLRGVNSYLGGRV